MKKFVAIMLAVMMVLSLAACGPINETEVSVLWADLADTKLHNSLENSMDKAMYVESINYTYYDANGDQAAQTKQAEEVLNKGCAVLMVNLVDTAAAQDIVDMAKAKSVPVVFFGCEVDAAVVSGYDKCVNVYSDHTTAAAVQAEQINDAVNDKKGENLAKLDKNSDGKITYVVYGSADVSSVTNLVAYGEPLDVAEAKNAGSLVGSAELIITDSDAVALEVLASLQAAGYNATDKTKSIPLYTIGSRTPAMDFTKVDEDLSAEDKAQYVYTISELIAAGSASGAATDNFDSICNSAAAAARSFIKGEAITETIVKVPFTKIG